MMRSERVRANDPLELVGLGAQHALAATGDAGVVHEDVDGAEVVHHRLDHGPIRFHRVDRCGIRRAFRPSASMSPTVSRGGIGVTPVVDGDVGSVGGQRERDGVADAPTPAGDESHSTSERCAHAR